MPPATAPLAGEKRLTTNTLTLPLRRPFGIARGVRTAQPLLRVEVRLNGHTGRGETPGVSYEGETPETLAALMDEHRDAIAACPSREALLDILPAGGARAAVDSAFWDLEAKLTGRPVWQLIGRAAAPQPVLSAFTISLDTPDAMAAQTRDEANRPLLKVKLGGRDGLDIDRARAVRNNAPKARLVADGNGGFTPDTVHDTALALKELGYELFEQPLLPKEDAFFDDYTPPLPLCADESLATLDDLPQVAQRYQIGNIKLDKCGGLTHGLKLYKALREKEMGVFIGTMLAGALSTAPALLLGQDADYVDLDGPLWVIDEAAPDLTGEEGHLSPAPSHFWGGAGPADNG